MEKHNELPGGQKVFQSTAKDKNKTGRMKIVLRIVVNSKLLIIADSHNF